MRLYNATNKVQAQRGRREKEWDRRETETVENDVGANGLLL
jgi:hypothetical protein